MNLGFYSSPFNFKDGFVMNWGLYIVAVIVFVVLGYYVYTQLKPSKQDEQSDDKPELKKD